MFGVCVTPGLQGDAPAAKSNVQAGSVFSAAGLQCCSGLMVTDAEWWDTGDNAIVKQLTVYILLLRLFCIRNTHTKHPGNLHWSLDTFLFWNICKIVKRQTRHLKTTIMSSLPKFHINLHIWRILVITFCIFKVWSDGACSAPIWAPTPAYRMC